MTTALAMYEGVLYELRKVQSPDFDVSDFNYFMPSAVEKWLKGQLDEFELTQKVTDKISCLVKASDPIVFNADNTTDVRLKDLPGDYRHLVNCLVRLRYKAVTPVYAVNSTRRDYTKRYTGDGKVNIEDNYYLRPLVSDSDVRLYHRTIGNKLSILFDTPAYPNTTVVIADAVIEYISEPQPIALNEDFTTLHETPFPSHANMEIVKICADLFLENGESPRLQSHIAVNS